MMHFFFFTFTCNLELLRSAHRRSSCFHSLLPPHVCFFNPHFTSLIHSYILYTLVIPSPNYIQPDSPPITGSRHFLMDMETALRVYLCFLLLLLHLTFLPLFSLFSPHPPLCPAPGEREIDRWCACVYMCVYGVCVCLCVLLCLSAGCLY